MTSPSLTGVGTLVRHHVRLDRWMVLWWSLGITLLYWSQAVSVEGLYATQEEFDRAAASMEGNAALVAMAGPTRALNTVGGQVTWQATAFGAIAIGLMSMFLVVRHTRTEEETGRDELVRAMPVGRAATTAATLVTLVLANVLVGALVALSLVSVPLATPDSVALGAGVAATGVLFGAVALLAAQLTSTPRAAYGITGVVIGAAYVLRAIGDLGTPALTWLSPIGWYQGMHAFSGLRWWPLALLLLSAVATTAVALAVLGRRDHGAGVLAARPGPARASAALGTPVGLAWRMQRGLVLGWAAGLLLTGLAYGSLGSDVGDLLGDSQVTEDVFVRGSASLVDGFYATAFMMLGLMACGFAISSALRPRHEEDAGFVEVLLATAVSRWRWLSAQVVVTVVGVLAVLVAGGLGIGIGYWLTTGDRSAVWDYTIATLPYAAPVLVTSGAARALVGLSPRWGSLAWLVLVFAAVVMMFARPFSMPEWLQWLSPFDHLALVPVEDFRWAPFVTLLVVAAMFSGAGQLLFRRRDIEVR